MSLIKKINDPNGKIYDDFSIGSLVLDTEPIPGSFNPVTSDGVKNAIDDSVDAAKAEMQEKIDEVTLDPSAVALGNVHLLDEVTEFPEDGCILVDSETNGPGEMSKDTLLELTAQNALAGNVAPAFVPNSTTTIAGQAYVYGGQLYVAKVSGYQGPWDASKFEQANLGFLLETTKIIANDDFCFAVIDSNERILFGVRNDGTFEWAKGVPDKILENLFSTKQDNVEYAFALVDKDGRLLAAYDKDSVLELFTRIKFINSIDWSSKNLTELERALKENGFSGGQGDWSDKDSLQIELPRLAICNFTNISSMPTTKTDNAHGILQFWDLEGNYFKKKVIMNAQGRSSMSFPKKNISLDLCNDDWEGDDTFNVRFGEWVAQDSFHLKAYWTDFFKCLNPVNYNLYKQIKDTRGILKNAPWKQALIENTTSGKGLCYDAESSIDLRMDNGAICVPQGFPILVFLNGTFYGIFSWQLKKHRDNYHQNKSNLKNVHIDGVLTTAGFWGGTIDWTQFEVRNPKGLKDVDGNAYDGDNPKELSGTDPKSAEVKGYIQDFATFVSNLPAAASSYGVNSQEFKELFESVFDIENLIDYELLCEFTCNTDCYDNNFQWVTYDGVHWWVNPYDTDLTYGAEWRGTYIANPGSSHTYALSSWIFKYLYSVDTYKAAMDARYKELRDAGILSVAHLVGMVDKWMQAVGSDNYKKEYDKWDMPCNSDMVVNDTYWELALDGEGKPIFGNASTYNSATSYLVNDEVYYGADRTMGFYKFICTQACSNQAPVTSFAYRDSLWRLNSWLTEHLAIVDTYYNYNQQ